MAGPDPTVTRAPIADDVTDAEIQQLIKNKKAEGATDCRLVTEGGRRFLVTTWPPIQPGSGG